MTDRTGATKKWNRIIIISCWMSVLLATTTVSSFQTSFPRRNRGIKGVSYNKATTTTTVVELIDTNKGVTKKKRKVRKKAVKKKKKSTVVLSIDNTANDTLDAAVKKKAKRKGKTKGSKTLTTKTLTSKTVDTKTKKKKKKFEFWSSTDPYVMNATHVQCTVRGNPQPLRRHRTGRGFLYNPSAPAQKAFRAVALEILGLNSTTDDSTTKNATSPTPHFGAALHVHIVFHCQRPKHHFTASRPGPGRLKVTAPATVQRRVDVDNLAKFVLDCFNDSALYGDDQQVVSLQGIKVYHDDDDDDCLGKTVLSMRAMSHDEVLAEAASAF